MAGKHSVDDSTLLDDSVWSFSDYDGQGNAAAAEELASAAEDDEEDDEEDGDVIMQDILVQISTRN